MDCGDGRRLAKADESGVTADQLDDQASTIALIGDGGQGAQRLRSAGPRTARRETMRTALRGLRCNALLGDDGKPNYRQAGTPCALDPGFLDPLLPSASLLTS